MQKGRIKCRSFSLEWSRSYCLIVSFLTEFINGSNSLLGHELLTNVLIKCQKKSDIQTSVWIRLRCFRSQICLDNCLTQTILVHERKTQSSWLPKLCLWLGYTNRLLLFVVFMLALWQGYPTLLRILCIWVRVVCRRAGVCVERDRHLVARPDNGDQVWLLFEGLES